MTALVGVDADVVLRILQPVVENACQCARGRVVLGVERRGSDVVFTIDDDGPGVRRSERERIFEPACEEALATPIVPFPELASVLPSHAVSLALPRRRGRIGGRAGGPLRRPSSRRLNSAGAASRSPA